MGWKPHWTPNYIASRALVSVDRIMNPRAPWMPRGVRRWLEDRLAPEMAGIEWGAGRSTIWIAPRVAQFISVEDNVNWYLQVRRLLQDSGTGNVRLIFAGASGVNEAIEGEYSPDYAGAAQDLAPRSMDFAVVDGKDRDLCALRAIELLKPEGFLLIDDCNRYLPTTYRLPVRVTEPTSVLWSEVAFRLKGWGSLAFSNGVQETRLFIKPVTGAAG